MCPLGQLLFAKLKKYAKTWPVNLDDPFFDNCDVCTETSKDSHKMNFSLWVFESVYVELLSNQDVLPQKK